jgi:hypothetical protein
MYILLTIAVACVLAFALLGYVASRKLRKRRPSRRRHEVIVFAPATDIIDDP